LEEDILDIDILAEIKNNNENILSEEDVLDTNTPAEIKKNKEKNIKI
jgi:hypothetical protein